MSGPWDTTMKKWVGEAPQDFVSWLLRDAVYERNMPSRLRNRNIDADLLYRIHINGRRGILHVEFQSTSHRRMAERMWEYNVFATLEYKIPVHSFLIYLKKGKEKDKAFAKSPLVGKSVYGEVMHYFSYKVIKMWEVPTDALLNSGHKGLLPLVPLTADGLQREAIEQAIAQLMPAGKEPEKELLSLLYAVGSMMYTTEENWFERRFDMLESILKDSWAYKKWKQKGIEEGVQKGIEEGVQKGRRQDIVSLVQKRFPSLAPLAQERVVLLTAPEKLQDLLLQIAVAKDEQEVRSSLLEATEEQKH